LLISEANVVLKGGVIAKLLEPLVTHQFKRIGPRTLAAGSSTSWKTAGRKRSGPRSCRSAPAVC
jgi:hypothetical protein